jgi:NADPH:quinone reductase-like Zn-dependent oxidoreductase
VVVPRGAAFNDETRKTVPDGVDALYDTALLRSQAFPAVRDDGQIAAIRTWEGPDSERGIQVRQVWVREVLERTDWLERLRDLASEGQLQLRPAGEYPPECAADAHRAMEAGGLRGRALIVF